MSWWEKLFCFPFVVVRYGPPRSEPSMSEEELGIVTLKLRERHRELDSDHQ